MPQPHFLSGSESRESRTEHERPDMMVFSTIQRIEQFDVGISSIRGTFEMVTVVSKMDEGRMKVSFSQCQIQDMQER